MIILNLTLPMMLFTAVGATALGTRKMTRPIPVD
jgi:hypothetical protein